MSRAGSFSFALLDWGGEVGDGEMGEREGIERCGLFRC